jgi:hypothetical protein
MKWFFFRLHNAIAERDNVKLAIDEHISYYDFQIAWYRENYGKNQQYIRDKQTENDN